MSEKNNDYFVVELFLTNMLKKLVDDRFYDEEKIKDIPKLEYISAICKLIKFLHECKQIINERICEIGFSNLTYDDNIYMILSFLASSETVGLYAMFRDKLNDEEFKTIYKNIEIDIDKEFIKSELMKYKEHRQKIKKEILIES